MKFIKILLSLMFSSVLGLLIASAVEVPSLFYVISGVSFVGSFAMSSLSGVLTMGYVAVDVGKGKGSAPGFAPPKDRIIVIRSRDVLKYPKRDNKGVVTTEDMLPKPGAIMMRIEVTAGTTSYGGTPEGDIDSRAVKQHITADAPGYEDVLAEFMANNLNEPVYVFLEFCDGSNTLLFGTPCAKMQMNPVFEGNNEKTSSKLAFESINKGPVVGIYKGALSFAEDFPVQPDASVIDATQGTGRYLIPTTNTDDVTVTGISNANEGQLITLVGSGGAHPSTIEESNVFIMKNGASWSSEEGSVISFRAFSSNKFIEQSRSV